MKKQDVLCLKPTQMAFGLKEARAKAEEFRKLGKKKLEKHLNANPVKVLRGPEGNLYVIDHHHEAYALLILEISKVKVKIIKDLGENISHQKFFKKLKKDHCVHLFDQLGRGPHSPLYLASDIRGMADDPYRSLVWAIRNEKLIGDSKERYYEFRWAQFFRKRHLIKDRSEKAFEKALKKARAMCRSRSAKNLPGFLGQKK